MAKQSNRSARKYGSEADKRRRDDGAPCPIIRECGGCEWLGLPYRKQLARKQAAMEELFTPVIERFGWDTEFEPIRLMGTASADGKRIPSPRGFRHKAATPFAPGDNGEVCCGFFARGTHQIVPCENCVVEAPGARAILNEVARAAGELGIPAYDEDRATGELRHAVVRMGWKTDEAMLTLVTRSRHVRGLDELAEHMMAFDPRLVTVAHNINPRVTNAILGGETHVLRGAPRMRDELLGCAFEISPVSFYQTNPAQTEILYRAAIDGLELEDGDTALDAYCGSGTIGLAAAALMRERGKTISLIGVERNPEGIRDAQRNAEVNGLSDRARFTAEDATRYLVRAASEGARIDALIMDPPRAGSTPEFIAAATTMGPRRIAYISCNPATQERDLNLFGEAGYRMLSFTPVDMFPHTSHVETVAILAR